MEIKKGSVALSLTLRGFHLSSGYHVYILYTGISILQLATCLYIIIEDYMMSVR